MSIAREISEHGFGTGEGSLGVDLLANQYTQSVRRLDQIGHVEGDKLLIGGSRRRSSHHTNRDKTMKDLRHRSQSERLSIAEALTQALGKNEHEHEEGGELSFLVGCPEPRHQPQTD